MLRTGTLKLHDLEVEGAQLEVVWDPMKILGLGLLQAPDMRAKDGKSLWTKSATKRTQDLSCVHPLPFSLHDLSMLEDSHSQGMSHQDMFINFP